MRRMYLNAFVLLVSLALLPGCSGTVRLGQTQSGAAVSFGKDATGGYRLLVQAPVGPLHTDTPAAILLFPEEGDGTTLKTVYRTVRKTREGVEALADIESDGSVFAFRDLWRIEGDALTLDRTVRVQGTCTGAGFSSLTGLQTSVDFRWEDGQYVFPGVVYGRPHTNALSKGGSKYFESGFFCVREDNLSAPLAVVSDSSFGWFGLLDPSPDGATTWTECTSPSGGKIIDAALGFGALDAGKLADGGVSLSFIYPGSCREFEGGGPFRRSSGAEKQVLTSRLHPVHIIAPFK